MICNLIADGLASGKNILVVSQKRAAIDVVYNRLNEKGLDEFAALIHDFKSDRKATYAKINYQIENKTGKIMWWGCVCFGVMYKCVCVCASECACTHALMCAWLLKQTCVKSTPYDREGEKGQL